MRQAEDAVNRLIEEKREELECVCRRRRVRQGELQRRGLVL